MTEDTRETAREQVDYLEIYHRINEDPFDERIWETVLSIAQAEEGTSRVDIGFYDRVPLSEITEVAQRLRDSQDTEEKYRILSERSTTGDLWYDIILGRVNDKLLFAMGQEIGNWRGIRGKLPDKRIWRKGLDLGTGTGNSLKELRKYTNDAIGVDLLDFLLPAARNEGGKNSLVAADVLNLPFANETFDLIQSNGLTFYLSKNQLQKFVDEVSRIMEPGGSYFQAYSMPPEENGILEIEREYLSSGKALLACLMDRMITHQYSEKGDEPSEFSLLSRAFEQRGFTRNAYVYGDKGVIILEFGKRFTQEFENLKRRYFSGDTYAAEQASLSLLYGPRAAVVELKNLEEYDYLPKETALRNLYFFERLAEKQEIIDFNPLLDYYGVFIRPLIDLVTNERYDTRIRSTAAQVMAKNLEEVSRRKNFDPLSQFWENVGFTKCCRRLKNALESKRGCEVIVTQIDEMLGGK